MATVRLHQLLAVEKDVRQTATRRITNGYQLLQRPAVLQGIARIYRPKDEDGDQLPPESVKVQTSARQVLNDSKQEFARLWDLVATKDIGNTVATADVVLPNGTVLAQSLPATYLLWLEKELNDLHTVVSSLPILDPTEDWTWSAEHDAYATAPIETHRTKKQLKVLTKAAATDKHPAQTEVYHEDVIVGYWSTVKFSGALPATEVRELIDRVNEVREAVKVARSKANETEVEQQHVAGAILDYIFP